MKNIILFFGLLLLVTSCTKVVDLNLGNSAGRLDIEANLTNINGPQTITLSKNAAFSSPNVYPPVSGAIVTLTDQNGNKKTLTETQPGIYTINSFAGVAGNTYTLNVATGVQTYTAQS